MESFKDRMRRIRKRAGFASQGKAAAAIGCERGTVSMWEAPSSNVRSVGSEWLFDVARAYQVRPEWINDLRAKDDGYPWSPKRSSFGVRESQYSGPDPAILRTAVALFLFDADKGGLRNPDVSSEMLLELYRRIEAHGGRLPDEEQEQFEMAAIARGAKVRKITGEVHGDVQREGRRGKR